MSDFTDPGPVPEPPELGERFDLISRGIGMILYGLSAHPMNPMEMRALAKELGYEPGELPLIMPATVQR
jgi:hypothetical protein